MEAVLGHLRKFLHDHSVVAMFEKSVRNIFNYRFTFLYLSEVFVANTLFSQYTAAISQDRADALADKPQSLAQNTTSQTLIDTDHSLSFKRESYFDREAELDMKFPRSAVSLYGSDPALSSLHSTGLNRAAPPIVTQVFLCLYVCLDEDASFSLYPLV